jgi:TRAP-type C4-dicarboxylate transport system substrate-binding protein
MSGYARSWKAFGQKATVKRSHALGLLAGGLALASMAGGAAAETTLTMSSYSPTSGWAVKIGVGTWIKNVEEATKGRVKVRLLEAPLGKPESHFDLARTGVADVTYGVLSYTPGRFEVGEIGGMPGIGRTGKSLSIAMWRLYQASPEFQKEFEGVHVLSLVSTSPQYIFSSKPAVHKIEDYKGLKIRVPGGLVSDAVGALGATPVLVPSSKAYEMLSTGILDGVAFPKDTIFNFKLQSLIKSGTFIPGGVGAAPIFLVMNAKKWASLPEEDRKAISSVSGETFASFYGALWDSRDAKGVELMKGAGIELVEADAALAKAAANRYSHIEQNWIAKVKKSRNIDGQKIFDMFRAETRKVESGS